MTSASAPSQAHRQASFHWDADQVEPSGAEPGPPAAAPVEQLLLTEMSARERVSDLFEYELVVSSPNENLDLNKVIGRTGRVEVQLPGGGGKRYFHGVICDLSFDSFQDRMAKYRVILRPWLWLLTQASNNRIFQATSVPAIIKKVCDDHGFTDAKQRLGRIYEKRVYCVQFGETDFHFISRLMEEEGIYYYFEHEKDKHVLVITDADAVAEDLKGYETIQYYPPDEHAHRDKEHLDSWTVSRRVRSGGYRLNDFNFGAPSSRLLVASLAPKGHANASFERYEYPGHYGAPTKGETIAKIRREEIQSDHEMLYGGGNARGLMPGFLFELKGFPRADQNRAYLTLELSHQLTLGGFDSGGVYVADKFEYRCGLVAVPSTPAFRPSRKTRKPRVHGPQTATVVAAGTDEILTDLHGRVKVKFHWDRAPASNETSSCYVRVAQTMAGSGWGAQFIPRRGQEVIVEFLDGDPDQPIITGCVYNASNKPPYELPANATQSGIKTRSSPGGQPNKYNEIRFEDKAGSEELYVQAEKDMKIVVKNNRSKEVRGDETVTVTKNRNHTITINDTRIVKGNDKDEITGRQDVTVDGARGFEVKGAETRHIRQSQTETVGLFWRKDVTGNIDITSAANINITAAGNAVVSDSNHVDISSVSWSITGVSGGITGVGLALTGSSNGLTGQALALTALNIGVTGIGVGFVGLDTGVTGAELKKTAMETKQTAMEIKNLGIVLKQAGVNIGNGAIALKNRAMTIFS